MMFCKLGSNLS